MAREFPVIVQYNPPDISPAEASLLIHRHAEPISLISLIYKWASEGLVSIKADYKNDTSWSGNKKIKKITIEKL